MIDLVSLSCWVQTAKPYIACFSTAAIVAVGIALVELLSRYGSGNDPRWIIFGKPQYIYYSINALSAIITLFVAYTTGTSDVIIKFPTDIGGSIIKSAELGIVSMFALRSSLYSIERNDKKAKFDLGPAQILNVLNRYLDRQMDQNRGTEALQRVSKIMEDFQPNLFDLGALCLAVPEAIPAEDMVRMRKNIETIRKSKEFSANVKPYIIGLELQKEVGADNLQAVVDVLKKMTADAALNDSGVTETEAEGKSSTRGTADVSTASRGGEDVLSSEEHVDDQLDVLYNEISSAVAPTAGEDGGKK